MKNKEKSKQKDELGGGQGRISRRGFLKGAGIAAGCVALSGLVKVPSALAAEDFQGYPDRYGMLTDITMCVGCRMCEFGCAKANHLPEPKYPPATSAVFETKRRTDANTFTVVNRYTNPVSGEPVYRKQQCMHCNEPACASACLVAALKKNPEGQVTYNENVCIGCRYCMVACPFNGLTYEYDDAATPAIRKCWMCFERFQQGLIPACAEICPTKATIFGKRSDLLKIAKDRIAERPDLYVDHIYGETEVGGTGWMYISSVPFDLLGLPGNLGKTPYPEYTRDFLLGVPLVLTMWPGLLAGVNALIKRKERLAQDQGSGKHEGQVKK